MIKHPKLIIENDDFEAIKQPYKPWKKFYDSIAKTDTEQNVQFISKKILRVVYECVYEDGSVKDRTEFFSTEKEADTFLKHHKKSHYEVSRDWLWYSLKVKQDTQFELGDMGV